MGKDIATLEHRDAIAVTDQATYAIAGVQEAKARELELACMLAVKRPRDAKLAESEITGVCHSPRFAKLALYQKPRGNGYIKDLSIRFVEEALRLWGNVRVTTEVVQDADDMRIVKVAIWDLETGTSYSEDCAIRKAVERSKPSGHEILSESENKKGQTVYLCKATDDEVRETTNNAVSRVIRNQGRRLLPRALQAECLELCLDAIAGGGDDDKRRDKPKTEHVNTDTGEVTDVPTSSPISEQQYARLWEVARSKWAESATDVIKAVCKTRGISQPKQITTDIFTALLGEVLTFKLPGSDTAEEAGVDEPPSAHGALMGELNAIVEELGSSTESRRKVIESGLAGLNLKGELNVAEIEGVSIFDLYGVSDEELSSLVAELGGLVELNSA